MEPDVSLNHFKPQRSESHWKETTWKQTIYPNVMDVSLDDFAPKLAPLEVPTKASTPVQEEPIVPATRQPEPVQPQTVQPLEVFPAPPEPLSHSRSSLMNILAPVSLNESAPKEAREPHASNPPIKIAHQGKAPRQDVSATDTAKLTEAIKTALGCSTSPGEDDRASVQGSERNSLPAGKSLHGVGWPNSSLEPPKMNGNTKPVEIGRAHV